VTSIVGSSGSGQKAATYLVPGRAFYVQNAQSSLATTSGCSRYSYSPSGAKTALSVTGSGVLQMGFFIGVNFTSQSARVTIVIDGVTVLNELRSGVIEHYGMIQVGNYQYTATAGQIWSTTEAIPFNESLVINVTCSTAAYYYYRYFKT
jgi:hypothetical protein